MFYHINVGSGLGAGFASWNMDKDTLINEKIIPFINKQIVLLHLPDGDQIFNFNSVTNIEIFKSDTELERPTQFLFNLGTENIQLIKIGVVAEELIQLFKSKNIILSQHAIMIGKEGNPWLIVDGNNYYSVTILATQLKIDKVLMDKSPTELENPEFRKRTNCTAEILRDQIISTSDVRTRSLLQKAFTKPLNQIFVIMKFGEESLDSAYEGVIKPLGTEYGYSVLRIDEVQNSGKITDQVMECIANSKLILADLSGERPNCYYEAGFAHAIGKELILTIKKGDIIHFDLAGYRFIEWATELELRKKLKERLESIKTGSLRQNK